MFMFCAIIETERTCEVGMFGDKSEIIFFSSS